MGTSLETLRLETEKAQDRDETESFLSRDRDVSVPRPRRDRDVGKNVSRPSRDRDVQDRDYIPAFYHHTSVVNIRLVLEDTNNVVCIFNFEGTIVPFESFVGKAVTMGHSRLI